MEQGVSYHTYQQSRNSTRARMIIERSAGNYLSEIVGFFRTLAQASPVAIDREMPNASASASSRASASSGLLLTPCSRRLRWVLSCPCIQHSRNSCAKTRPCRSGRVQRLCSSRPRRGRRALATSSVCWILCLALFYVSSSQKKTVRRTLAISLLLTRSTQDTPRRTYARLSVASFPYLICTNERCTCFGIGDLRSTRGRPPAVSRSPQDHFGVKSTTAQKRAEERDVQYETRAVLVDEKSSNWQNRQDPKRDS